MRYWIKLGLTKLGLMPIARRIIRGLAGPVEHGHTVLITMVCEDMEADRVPQGGVIEIGTTRVGDHGQGSTFDLAELSARINKQFVTVDVDPENTLAVQTELNNGGTEAKAVCQKGEDFLLARKEPIAYLYLDAFDYEHDNHPARREERYVELLGTNINNRDCHQMHLSCAEAALDLVAVGGVVVFDDVWKVGRRWEGKGALAIPFLMGRGFIVEHYNGRAAGLRRVK